MDQSAFNQSQFDIQAPPEEIEGQQRRLEQAADPEFQKKKRTRILIGVGVSLGVVSIIGVGLTVRHVTDPENQPVYTEPTPPAVVLPTNAPRGNPEFQQRLIEIEEQIDTADPAEIDLDPPPLNYRIKL